MNHPLQSFEIYLRNLDGPLPIQAVRAEALNGMFYTEMKRRAPAWVEAMHQNGGQAIHPFSLSLLFKDGLCYGFRAAALTRETGEFIADVWGGLAARAAEVRLGSANMLVERVRPGSPRAASYAQLWETAPTARGMRIRFETPMKLLVMGHATVLPMPRLVWEWYSRRWQAFAGIELPPEFSRWVEWQVHALEAQLETCYAFVEKAVAWKGVVGEVAYHAFEDDRDLPASRYHDYLRAWQALAHMAEFSGTGEKVTMGMGRTHFVKAEGTLQTTAGVNEVNT